MVNTIIKIYIAIFLISISFEGKCHEECKECFEYSDDDNYMKCITCNNDVMLLYNTTNCVNELKYKDYYINLTDLVLYPCSLIDNKCYECEPSLRTEGKCLSCKPGYKHNNITNICEKCKENEFPIILGDFDNCQYPFVDSYCDLYTTYCNSSENEEIICPDKAPIYNTITKSCHEFDCQNKGLENGICLISKKKCQDRMVTVNWFINDYNYNQYPSYNVDNSGYLIIGLSPHIFILVINFL